MVGRLIEAQSLVRKNGGTYLLRFDLTLTADVVGGATVSSATVAEDSSTSGLTISNVSTSSPYVNFRVQTPASGSGDSCHKVNCFATLSTGAVLPATFTLYCKDNDGACDD